MIAVRVPTPLRAYTGGLKEIQIESDTVGGALAVLTSRYPELKRHIFNEDGELRSYVNLFLNDKEVRTFSGTHTHLQDGDRLMIVPSIAGGTGG
jgi:adenylyltransferase/sulfurtransferase